MKSIFKFIYRHLPFKRPLVYAIRTTGILKLLPKSWARLLMDHLVFEGPFRVNVQSSSFQMLHGYGREIESSIFWGGINNFETQTLILWQILSKRSSYIFDIGANTGVYSLVSKALNPSAHIYGFEPMKRIFAILEANISLTPPVIAAHRIALSDYSGLGEMYDLPVEHMYTASLNRNVHQERGQTLQAITETVPVMRLDEFVKQHGIPSIDLIKIDVESHEPAVLRGMGDCVRQFLPTLIVEIWNNDVGIEVEAVISDCPYVFYAITESGPQQTSHIRNDAPDEGYLNYLICTKQVSEELGLQI